MLPQCYGTVKNESCGDVSLRSCDNVPVRRCQDVAATLLQRRPTLSIGFIDHFMTGNSDFFPVNET